MLRFRYFATLIYISLFCAGFFCSSVFAATLDIDYDTGQLLGASDVEVVINEEIVLLDVAFVDKTGASIFSDDADFGPIVSEVTAAAASLALLDQVFVNQYDSITNLTFGITSLSEAIILTAFDFYETGNLKTYYAINYASNSTTDTTEGPTVHGATSSTLDMAGEANMVYAVWTVAASTIPEPGTILMVGFGLLSLAGMKRRRN